MKNYFILLTLLFAFALITCEEGMKPTPTPEPTPPQLDQRLIGGRWYFPKNYSNTTSLTPDTSNGYYKFTDDNKLIFSDETVYKIIIDENYFTITNNEVYSNNGFVYFKNNNMKIMSYEFHSSYPFQSGFTSDERGTLSEIAAHGDYITYRLYDTDGNKYGEEGTMYDIVRRFLVRFNDDGSIYQDYGY